MLAAKEEIASLHKKIHLLESGFEGKLKKVEICHKEKTDYLTSEVFLKELQTKDKTEWTTLLEAHKELLKNPCGALVWPHHHNGQDCSVIALQKRVASLEKILESVIRLL